MASTYENDLRLEEMATGENSGSWGTKTNTNLELVADAFSYGTETIADADTAITIADGAADAARSLALKINSSEDLTTTRVVTLGPNTTSKVWIIENNTSGGQTLTISAGSGSNITLANGTTKIIATDGIGAGSNVVELTQDIAIADMSVDGILSLADGTNSAPSLTNTGDTNTGLYFPAADEVGITVGGTQVLKADSTGIDVTGTITFDGGSTSADLTFGDGDKAIFGAGGDLQIYHDTHSYIHDTGDGNLLLLTQGAEITLLGNTSSEYMGRFIQDGAVELYHDAGLKLATTATGVDITGTAVTDGLTSSGVLSVDADAISQIKSGVASDVLRLGNDAGTYVLGFASALASMDLGASDNFRIRHGAVESFRATPSGVVLNEVSSSSVDFRVESDSYTHMLFVDAENNRVSIGESTNVPIATLEVVGGPTMTAGWDRTLVVAGDSSSGFPVIVWNSQDLGYAGIGYDRTNTTSPMKFWTGSTTSDVSLNGQRALELGISGGESVFNQSGSDIDFRVQSAGQEYMLFVDASSDRIGINEDSPDAYLHISGMAASSSSAGVIFEGSWPWLKFLDTEADQDTYSIYNDDALFFSRLSYAQRNDAPRSGTSGGTAVNHLELRDTENIFNNEGQDIDFRVESNSQTHMVFVDANNNRLGIRESSPSAALHVTSSDGGNYAAIISHSAATNPNGLKVNYSGSGDTNTFAFLISNTARDILDIRGTGSLYHNAYDGGAVVFNDGGNNADFRVESDTNTHALFVEGGHGAAVGVGTASPTSAVSGDAIIGLSSYGIILQQQETSVASGSSVDLTVNSGGGGYQGMLIISNTVTANAAARTQAMYFVAGRGTDGVFNLISQDDGTTGGAGYSLTFANNGLIRMTNNSGNATNIVMSFFGSKSL